MRNRSVLVGFDTELAHRLAEAERVVASQLRLQIPERDVVVSRLLQGRNELSLIAEPLSRLVERDAGRQHRFEARTQLRIHFGDKGSAVLSIRTTSPASSSWRVLIVVGIAATAAAYIAVATTGIFRRRLARITLVLGSIAATSTARILTPISRVTWCWPGVATMLTRVARRHTCVAVISAAGPPAAAVRSGTTPSGDLWTVSSWPIPSSLRRG